MDRRRDRLLAVALAVIALLALLRSWPRTEPPVEPLPEGWIRFDTSGLPEEARVGYIGLTLRPGVTTTPEIVDYVRTVRRSLDEGSRLLSIERCGDQ